MRRAGISGHMLYDLRHTFASRLLAKNKPITYVAAQVGHANAGVTLKYYARWIPTGDRSFVDSLDSFGTTLGKDKQIQGEKADFDLSIRKARICQIPFRAEIRF